MLRSLVIAALLTFAAVRIFNIPADLAGGYALVICLTLWLIWPAARTTARAVRRIRRRRKNSSRVPATSGPTTTPTLTQINHHHHYYGGTPPPAAPQIDPTLRGLPQHSQHKRAHDAIWHTIDSDDVGDNR